MDLRDLRADLGCHAYPAVTRRVLRRVGEEVRHDLSEPDRVTLHPHGCLGQAHREAMPTRLDLLAGRVDRVADDAAKVQPLEVQA